MRNLQNEYIDLTVTSPPYDSLRAYESLPFGKFEMVAMELFRVTKAGGVLVWVVSDATIKGDETGTSFKQVLRFKEIGFKLHDTMIYDRGFAKFPRKNGYGQSFEYMFILAKNKPKTFNPIKEPSSCADRHTMITDRMKNGETRQKVVLVNSEKTKRNVWLIDAGYMRSTKDKIAYQHPATFPEKLANDHIISWSNQSDTVLDPFMGSGTTGKMAKILGRKFIGIEKDEKYFQIACERLGYKP